MADLVEAFAEIRTVRGYRMLDLRGQIMSDFDADFSDIQTRQDTLEILLTNAKDPADVKGLRVNPELIWLQFRWPQTFQQIIDHTILKVGKITETTGVTDALRFGLRTRWIVPADNAEHAAALAAAFSLNPKILGLADSSPVLVESSATWKLTDDASVKALVQARTRAANVSQGPAHGVMLDLDFFRVGTKESPIPMQQLRRFLRDAERESTRLQLQFEQELK